MAKKGLFGRLADSVRKTVSRLFGFEYPDESSSVPQTPTVDTPEPVSIPKVEPVITRDTSKLDNLRQQYEGLISEANQRWEMIEAAGYKSMAISRARDEGGRDYFTLDYAESEGDILNEVTRARVFIADRTSTLEGAELYTAEINSEQFRGKFGSEYRKPEYGNKGFDPAVIDEEYAKEVFSSYRRLEETKQGLIEQYGSENLIIAMYDAKVRDEDPYLAGQHLIDLWYKTHTEEWQDRFDQAQREYTESKSYRHGTAFDYLGDEEYDRDDDMYF